MNRFRSGERGSLFRKGLWIIALPVSFQILLLVVVWWQEADDRQRDTSELRTKQAIASAYRVTGLVVDLETGMRGYAATGNRVFAEPFERAARELPGQLVQLRQLSSGEAQAVAIHQVESLANAVLTHQSQNEVWMRSGERGLALEAIADQSGKKITDAFRVTMNHLIDELLRIDSERTRAASAADRRTDWLLAGGFVVNLTLAVIGARYFARTIARRVMVVIDNAILLERGRPLLAAQTGGDEIALLDLQFHRMAGTIRARTRELEEANAELESFSYSVSHDLRAPLRAIDGYAQMLAEDYEGKFDADGSRFLGVIRSEASRLGHLIDDLLAFSHLGRKALLLAGIDVGKLAVAVFEEAAQGMNARLTIAGDLPPALADAPLLRQVLTNLFTNALKFSRRKLETPGEITRSITREIQVGLGGKRGTALNTYWVRDQGVGFDPKYTHKLFGVFQRLHADDQFEGTGVGLAIVRRVIRRHGGDVWAEGILNEGATFYFTLPAVAEEAS